MTVSPLGRKRLGVFPRSAFQSESRLLASLAQLYPVEFSPEGETGFDQMDAAIFFSDEEALASRAFERGVSSFLFRSSRGKIGLAANTCVSFSGHTSLHPAFRNARIPLGSATKAAELNGAEGDSTLDSNNSLNLWVLRSTSRAELHAVATEVPSLQSGRLLWQDLRPDGWFAAFPLLQFVRRVTTGVDWSPATQQACFIVDDPNLHSVRYGYIDFAGLAFHARGHNYHVAIATVPLDAWYAGRKAIDIFHRHNECLSLVIHGNDHLRNELGCDYSEGDAVRMLAQALRRTVQLEHRTGLRVERVIAPPHGGCSNSVLAQAARLPIEGVCTSAEPLARCQNWTSLPLNFGLLPAWFGLGACPVIRRWDLAYGLMPLRLAAFLSQPIIAYGHHQDCAQGFGPLAEIASVVNSWAQTNWTSLETILRGNYRTMRDNELMHVQMCSRSINVPIPENVSHLAVHVPGEVESVHGLISVSSSHDQALEFTPGVPFRVTGPGELRLRIRSRDHIDPAAVGRPAYRLWPPVRRALSIGRDRLMPILRKFPSSSAAEFQVQQG